MRVVYFIVILVFTSMIGVAQTEQTVQTEQKKQTDYKLGKGNFTTEMQLSLFSTSSVTHYDDDEETVSSLSSGPLSLSGLRLRYAFNEKWALRFNVNFDFGHDKQKKVFADSTFTPYYDDYSGTWIDTKDVVRDSRVTKNSYTEFSIAPGIEYHFGKWERLSVYVGGELVFGLKTTKSSSDLNNKNEHYEYGNTGK